MDEAPVANVALSAYYKRLGSCFSVKLLEKIANIPHFRGLEFSQCIINLKQWFSTSGPGTTSGP